MSKAPDFSYTLEQVKALPETVIRELEEKLKVLVNIPGPQRNFRNTMRDGPARAGASRYES